MNTETCQACGEPILLGSDVICVSYGVFAGIDGRNASYVSAKRKDFFHKRCAANVAIAQPVTP